MSVAFSPDSNKLVSGSLDTTVRVWTVSTGILLVLRGHRSSVNSVAFSPDGSQVVSGSTDQTIRIWDATSGTKVIRIRPALMNPSPSDTPRSNFSSGRSGFGIGLWDPFSGSSLLPPTSGTLPGEYCRFGSVMFSPDGSQILSGSPRPHPFNESYPVNHSVQFSHDGSKIVSARGNTIFVWETATSTPLARILCLSPVSSAIFSPDSSQVITGCSDGSVIVWDVLLVRSPSIPARFSTCLAMSTDKSKVALGNWEGTQIWDVSTGASISSPRGGKQPQAVALSSDGSKIASGRLDGTIQVWDVSSGMSILEPIRGHNGAISALAFCSDGTRIASAAKDMMIRVWDASSGIASLDIALHGVEHSRRHCAVAIAFSRDTSKIASVSEDASIQIWDAQTGAPLLAPLVTLRHQAVAVAFSPRDSKIVSVCSEGSVLVSHLASSRRQNQQCITHSEQRGESVESPGKVVEYPLQLEESDDFAVCFPEEISTGARNPFTAMTSPNGVAIVTVDEDDQLVVVDIPLEVGIKKKHRVPVRIR
ncbi:hypothetical protein JAAARDRAFT_67607 [Jaapia argillacea MUCL 33604]|uniref:Uncharacterized protein n=1 Tax=Jaapia argillacea MUCL 33604 TaxID=933084 RepID=A0A067QCM6_9AGAM|nr:hypothetical protein JAAARDRAFT_67607 [Jaapia argillacea MUCL 33604]